MNTLDIKPGERVKDVYFTEDNLSVDLIDCYLRLKTDPSISGF